MQNFRNLDFLGAVNYYEGVLMRRYVSILKYVHFKASGH